MNGIVVFSMLFLFSGGAVAQEKTAAPAPPDSAAAESLADYSRERLIYETGGKRDPFNSLVPEQVEAGKKIKGLLDYEKATLRGIVRTDDDLYALVIDADGFGHVLREGYMVYGGYVISITDDSVKLHIVKYGRAMTIILSLETSKSTVLVEENGERVIKRPGINIFFEQGSQAQREIGIEDIVVPSLNTRTIDKVWFGDKGGLPVIDKSAEPRPEIRQSFSLFNPADNEWVKLPYEMNWTNYPEDGTTYIIVIDDDVEFNSPHVALEQVSGSAYLLVEDMKLPVNRTLYWKVIAVDSSGREHPCRQPYVLFKIAGLK